VEALIYNLNCEMKLTEKGIGKGKHAAEIKLFLS
jgi:hypothetical protein